MKNCTSCNTVEYCYDTSMHCTDHFCFDCRVHNMSVMDLQTDSVHQKVVYSVSPLPPHLTSCQQILSPVDPSQDMLTTKLTLFKRASQEDEDRKKEEEGPRDLTSVDMSVEATVQRIRAVVVFRLFNRLIKFGNRLRAGLHESVVSSAREAASKTAARTVSPTPL